MRPSQRLPDQLRPLTIERNFTRHAEGSVLIRMGDTHVLYPPVSRKACRPSCAAGAGLGHGRVRHAAAPTHALGA